MNRKTSKRLRKLNSKCYRQTQLCLSITNFLCENHCADGAVTDLDVDVLCYFLSDKLKYIKKTILKAGELIYKAHE